jgi:hypothetical protein
MVDGAANLPGNINAASVHSPRVAGCVLTIAAGRR